MKPLKHLISILDTSSEQVRHLLDVAYTLKDQFVATGKNDPILAHKTLAMIFEKPSLRTRVSFSVGMTHLGGTPLVLSRDEVGLGVREPVEDVARVLGSMCDGIMARVFEHNKLIRLAKHAGIPIINGLSDHSHPCQALADLMTVEEHFGDLTHRTLAYVGDGNNVARSLAEICGRLGVRFQIATPKGYELPDADIKKIAAKIKSLDYSATHDPKKAVRRADIIYTDTWVSMGQEAEKQKRLTDFTGFCVDESLLAAAPKHAIVLHCLPAYRGYEISAGVMEHPRSRVFQQAENRLHAQKGVLACLMGGR